MVATFNNAILGPVLRVGTIPSLNASPNFSLPSGVQSLDGGLLTNNGNQSGTMPGTIAPQCWWIGPDGHNSAPVLDKFLYDMFKDVYSGGWFDPINNAWGTVQSPFLNAKPSIGYLRNLNGLGDFSYSTFRIPAVLNAIKTTGIYDNVSYALYGGYANNFIYGGIDQIIVNATMGVCGSNGSYSSQIEVSIPYGLFGMDYSGSPYNINAATGCPVESTASPLFDYWIVGPIYRPYKGRGLYSTVASAGNQYNFTDNSGHWIQTTFNSSPIYLGRLWDGFVFSGAFTTYSGCVFTEDFITFRPLLDITGQIDFSNQGYFGFGSIYFMNSLGYSYLANYNQSTTPYTQAAYKIYPAFNFTPMVPDSFFIPSVCGCNRRSNRA